MVVINFEMSNLIHEEDNSKKRSVQFVLEENIDEHNQPLSKNSKLENNEQSKSNVDNITEFPENEQKTINPSEDIYEFNDEDDITEFHENNSSTVNSIPNTNKNEVSETTNESFFVEWNLINKEVLETCGNFIKPKKNPKISNPGDSLYFHFDFKKFYEMNPEKHPNINPKKQQGRLYIRTPLLKTPFGYAPFVGKDGKISNSLRLNKINNDEDSEKFFNFLIEWDEWICEKFFKIMKGFNLSLGIQDSLDDFTKKTVLKSKYCGFLRSPRDSEKYSEYFSVKYPNVYVNNQLVNTPYAKVKVWDTKDNLIGRYLDQRNMSESAKKSWEKASVSNSFTNIEDKNEFHCPIKIESGDLIKVVFHFQKLFVVQQFGPTCVVKHIQYTSKDEMKEDEDNQTCPF